MSLTVLADSFRPIYFVIILTIIVLGVLWVAYTQPTHRHSFNKETK